MNFDQILEKYGITADWVLEKLKNTKPHQTYREAFGDMTFANKEPKVLIFLMILSLAKRIKELEERH